MCANQRSLSRIASMPATGHLLPSVAPAKISRERSFAPTLLSCPVLAAAYGGAPTRTIASLASQSLQSRLITCPTWMERSPRSNHQTASTKLRQAGGTSVDFSGYDQRHIEYAAWTNEIARFFARPDRGLGVDTSRGRAWSLASGHKRPVATHKRLVCVAFRRCSLSGSGLVVEKIRWD
jgi:hypothetical protein